MGTYLATGIVQKIVIRKNYRSRYLNRPEITLETLQEGLRRELNIDHYNLSEDDDQFVWTIKPEMLEGNFAEFVSVQQEMYQGRCEKDIIDQIREAKTGDKIIQLAQERRFENFQMVSYMREFIEVPMESGFTDDVPVDYEMIALFLDGKIIMECYGRIFHYFERNIRLQENKYPVAACLKIMISG